MNYDQTLVSRYMFSGSRYTTVPFRKATHGDYIGFSRWPPYKTNFYKYLIF